MANLVPERRMNKNGVWVTKHVRPASTADPSAPAMPPPAALSGPARLALQRASLGPKARAEVAAMEPGVRSRVEAFAARRAAFVDIVASTYRFDQFTAEVLTVRDARVRDAALGIVAAVSDEALEWTVDLDVCRGLMQVPDLSEHIDDLTSAPEAVVRGAERIAEFVHSLRWERGGEVLAHGRDTLRIADPELEAIVFAEDGFLNTIEEWASSAPRGDACPEALKFVWSHPEDRAEFGEWIDLYTDTDHDLVRLVVERWDRREEVMALLQGEVNDPAAIRAVLDGDVPPSLARGAL